MPRCTSDSPFGRDSTEVCIDAVFLLSLAEEAGVVVRGSGSVAI